MNLKEINRFSWQAFSVAAPTLWNTLPLDIRNSKTVSIIKNLLKTYLHVQAFEH